jgi:hypothetical protein
MSGLFDANAGDYLISHTLSRAVPSARRGLTSVFGMGTGVTLAVCSPASLDAALGGSFPAAISLHTRAVSPRNENGKLAPQNLHSKTNCIGGAFTALKACVEYLLTADLLRRINSMDKPNGRLVLVSYAHYCASTSSLSTRWSSWALLFPFGLGDLILGRASRLYAFSGYHNRTSLPSRALGRTTGTQEVRPSRSSRTKDSPPQISYAHSR